MPMALHQAKTVIKTTSGLDALAGLWLILAPFLLGYADVAGAVWNSIIFGVAVVLLAGARTLGEGYRHAWPSWINVVIGLWLIIAPFVIGYAQVTAALWNDIIIGIVIAGLAAWGAMSTPREEDVRREEHHHPR
jgi:hypothetical protein